LDYADQAVFLLLRATGSESVAQLVWIYERPVDVARLERFHGNLGFGLLGRCIQPSRVPFGRHRWVAATGPWSPLAISEKSRPRDELGDWLDERAQLSVDPEVGPGWHLGAASFSDGSTAVTLVASHCLVDGMGLVQTAIDAIDSAPRDLNLPSPGQRTKWRGIRADLRETVRSLPDMGKAIAAGARLAIGRRHQESTPKAAKPTIGGPASRADVFAPAIVVFVDAVEWDTRAESLDGNNHSLVAGFAAKLAENFGRTRRSDGAVTLIIPVSDRADNETRANAVTLGHASLDPGPVTTSLAEARSVIRDALKSVREVPDESLQMLPLVPFVPKFVVARGADVMFGFATDLPVSASNLGDVDSRALRADGTEAELFFGRGVDSRVPMSVLEQRRGFLTVVCMRAAGKVALSIVAYQPGAENSKSRLRQLARRTLDEFDLIGTIA